MYALSYPLLALVQIIDTILFLYVIVLVAAVVVSWVNADPYNPIVRVIHGLTEPVLARVRRYIPPLGGLDLTPLIVLLGISFVRMGILPIFGSFAAGLQ